LIIVDEKIIEDMDLAREVLAETDCSIVIVKNGDALIKKKGDGIRPILEVIGELKEEIQGSIIGDRILGKASALLCRYSKAKGVYSPQATKTAIAVLIIAGIPSQIDEMIPYIKNRDGNDVCPFEKMLSDIDSPEEAYEVLKEKVFR
jgi:Domain of unknown function (DUF1893)